MNAPQYALALGLTGMHVIAIVQIARHKLPEPFPWKWSLLFLAALVSGALAPLGTPDKAYAFLAVLSGVVVGARMQLHRALQLAAIALAAVVVADALGILPRPDQSLPGESFFNGLVRRPYFLSHPNSVSGWALLLPFGIWTPIVVAATQSRGALIGLGIALLAGYTPRRIAPLALLASAVVFVGATIIRPGTMLSRVDYWREGVALFAAQPLTGWGSSSYSTSLDSDSAEAQKMNAITERTGMPHAHNALVTIMAENGLVGLAAFGGMAAGVFALVRRSRSPARWGLLAFWAQQLFDDQWLHPVTAVLLGLAIGTCLFEQRPNSNTGEKGGCHGTQKPQGPPGCWRA